MNPPTSLDSNRSLNLAWPARLAIGFAILLSLAMAPRASAQVANLAGVQSLAVGGYISCALMAAGPVKCWGANEFASLGDGTLVNSSKPVNVVGLDSGIVAITAGQIHACALTTGGGVKCWGYNLYGQLGDGTTADRSTPVDVQGLGTTVVAIAAGGFHTCALTSAGGLKCWGQNDDGQLGDGTLTNRSNPVDVAGLTSGVAAIGIGYSHNCALTQGGGIKCWGRNTEGQLGDGSLSSRTTPVDVVGLQSGAIAVSGGVFHTCAVAANNGAQCWGSNASGQLGDSTTADRVTPVGVSSLSSGVASITAGWRHTCALISGGGVKCWGRNAEGQLGDNTLVNRSSPVSPQGLTTGAGTVSAGGFHTCSLSTSGAAKCWGRNDFGQVGDGTTTNRSVPTGVRDNFFQSQVNVPRSTLRVSNAVTPTGFASPVSLAVSNGEYSIGCSGSFTASAGQLSPGSSLCVRHLSSSAPDTTVTTTLTVGTVVESFSTRTAAALTFLGRTLPAALLGGAYSQQLSASGGFPPLSYTVASGLLPPGLALSPSGLLSGTPTAPGSFSFTARASDSVGQTADAQFTLAIITDSTPDPFSFPTQSPVPVNSLRVSAIITPTGFNVPVSVSVTNGAYSAGCTGTFTTTPGQLSPGNSVCVRHISSNLYLTTVTTTLIVGGVSATFSSQTAARLEFFNTFLPSAATGSPYSQAIGISGGTPPVNVSVTSGSLPPGLALSANGTLSGTPTTPGRFGFGVAASDSGGQTAEASLSIEVLDADPDPFGFALQRGVPVNSVRTSNLVTLSGFAVSAPMTVENGEYSINCSQAFQSAPTFVTSGTAVCVRHVSGALGGVATTTTLRVGGQAGTFTSIVGTGPVAPLVVGKSGAGEGRVVALQGGIDCGGDCDESYPLGAAVTLVATPELGSAFEGWSGACWGTGPCSVTVDSARSVTATFGTRTLTRLINISTRGLVKSGNDVMIGGFVIAGSRPKKVLITARGPSLAPFGISNPLSNPRVELFQGQSKIAENDDWEVNENASEIARLGPFPSGLAPSDPTEAALLVTLSPGAYTAVVSGADNRAGVGIVEVYEQDGPSIPLINISTRGAVESGDRVMIGGFVITGETPQTVLITSRGPSLAEFGIANYLGNPKLEIFSGQSKILENDDWQIQNVAAGGTASANAIAALGTFPNGLAPSNYYEAALLVTLAPGAYTAVVSGADGGVGVAIVEVFSR